MHSAWDWMGKIFWTKGGGVVLMKPFMVTMENHYGIPLYSHTEI